MNYYDFDVNISAIHLALSRKCRLNWNKEEPLRPCCSLVYIENGCIKFSFPDGSFVLAQKDDIVWFKYGDMHTTNAIGDTNAEFICISFHIEPRSAADLLPFDSIIRVKSKKRYLEMFKSIQDACYLKGPAYKLYARSMIQLLIYNLLTEHIHERANKLGVMNSVIEYIDEYYNSTIHIEDLAKISGYSVSHFRKKFKTIFNLSPIDYINQVRVEKAKEKLKSRIYSIPEVAKECGFENAYYFSRVFKKVTGMSPSEF